MLISGIDTSSVILRLSQTKYSNIWNLMPQLRHNKLYTKAVKKHCRKKRGKYETYYLRLAGGGGGLNLFTISRISPACRGSLNLITVSLSVRLRQSVCPSHFQFSWLLCRLLRHWLEVWCMNCSPSHITYICSSDNWFFFKYFSMNTSRKNLKLSQNFKLI